MVVPWRRPAQLAGTAGPFRAARPKAVVVGWNKEDKMLSIGSLAPRFTARTQNGRIIRLDDFIGKKNVVLYFFSREGTPG